MTKALIKLCGRAGLTAPSLFSCSEIGPAQLITSVQTEIGHSLCVLFIISFLFKQISQASWKDVS